MLKILWWFDDTTSVLPSKANTTITPRIRRAVAVLNGKCDFRQKVPSETLKLEIVWKKEMMIVEN